MGHTIQQNQGILIPQAGVSRRDLARVEAFIDALHYRQAQRADHAVGYNLLKEIEEKTEVHMFHAAVAAGQQAASSLDIEEKLRNVHAGIEQARQMADRLRAVLRDLPDSV